TATVSFNDIKSCVEAWNGISSNVSVTCVRLSDVTPDMDIIATIVRANNYHDGSPIDLNTAGYTNTLTGGIERSFNGSDEQTYLDHRFDSAVIYISQHSFVGELPLTPSRIKTTITHEVGHALKMKHEPDQYGAPLYKSSFPSIMRTMSDNSGTNYFHSQLNYESYNVTIFDTSALIAKWGD
ncbi:MAG: hypothetical protein IKX86_04670, partial [Clostridia bacterium]|nr:hypothetical protein [Clostridia bacterium]